MTKEQILNWSADQQLLAKIAPNTTNRYGAIIFEKEPIELFATGISEEADKIEIISKFDDKFIRVLELIDLFEKEKNTVKRDSYGYKTTSLKAWINRNKANSYLDDFFHYGDILRYKNGSSNFYIQDMVYAKNKTKFINVVFVTTLIKLRSKELEYYLDHDEYTILKRKWEDEHISEFGVILSYHSSGRITIRSKENNSLDRDITIEELKQLLEMNNKVKAYIQKLTDECDIKY